MSTVIGNENEMLYFPYNSETDADGMRDRLYDAEDWRDNFALFIGDGVFPNPSSGLRVDAVGGMVLSLRAGNGWIKGGSFVGRRDFEFPVSPAHLTLSRRDVVVLRHDVIARKTLPHYITGTPASVPQPPSLIRTDDMFDLRLCEITVGPNAQQITQANILDTRPNNALCGFVTGFVHSVDTTDLFMQYETYLNEQIALWEQRKSEQVAEWEAWAQNWTLERDTWTQEQREHFERLSNEIIAHIQALETQSFTLINNNFDDWSVKRGTTRTTDFLPDGNILETITVDDLSLELATRLTEFQSDGSIRETVSFNAWERVEGARTIQSTVFKVQRTTIFNPDGTIKEVIR